MMNLMRPNLIERFSTYVHENSLYGQWGYSALNFRCQQLFKHVDGVAGKRLLDIGGGEGVFALWALANGAERMVVLEPEADGSSSGVRERFHSHRATIGFTDEQLALSPLTLQAYEGEGAPFDVILSYSSINHLDEEACITLQNSREARVAYLDLFKKILRWLRPGGHFVVSDAGRVNYWDRCGLPSPVARTIEWHKHQEPEVWRDLLAQAGFDFVAQEWHRFYPLRWLGPIGANPLIARLTVSQFVLTVCRPR